MGTISHTVTTWDTLGREEKGVPIALDYRQAAQEILDAIGGPGNVVSAAHCATRLRLVLADDAKVDQAAVDNATGAKGNFKASGQLQVIYGTGTVNKVYDEFIALGHISAATKAEAKEAAAQQQTNPLMRAIKLLGDVFVPIIPAIVASGLLLGIMSALSFMDANGFITLQTDNAWYQILNLVSNTAFTFLQILIGFSAAKLGRDGTLTRAARTLWREEPCARLGTGAPDAPAPRSSRHPPRRGRMRPPAGLS